MHLEDEDAGPLKNWVIKKLENISDADSDVLADYVLALVKSDDPEPVAKSNCVENLKDFLNDNAQSFVDEAFAAIANRSYDPTKPTPKTNAILSNQATRQQNGQQQNRRQSKKRGYRDWDSEVANNGSTQLDETVGRPVKQMKRGGRGGGRNQPFAFSNGPPFPYLQEPMSMGTPPSFPSFDLNNPMAALKAMQQMMEFWANGQQDKGGFTGSHTRQRCRDYDTQGFCTAGASCPYEHGEVPFVLPPANLSYNPFDPSLVGNDQSRNGTANTGRGRGPSRKRGQKGSRGRGGDNRSNISLSGPNRDKSATTIVVEHIPQDNCYEDYIREFFSEFGNIEEISVHPEKQLATVKYEDHAAAQKAYDSPKSIFDNRFVKVFWHKPEKSARVNHTSGLEHDEDESMQDADPVDYVEFSKRQEEAQRKYEEAKKSRAEADKQKQDIDNQLQTMEAERRKIAEALVKKTGQSTVNGEANGGEDNERTRALKEQLARLEAEAKSLGIDPDVPATNGSEGYPSYAARGGFRGRGRGRGFRANYRGAWSGASGRVMRLDNRPKSIAVVFSNDGFSYDHHKEKMMQYMLFNSLQYSSIAEHPTRDDAALVTFDHRFEGEIFMSVIRDGKDLPFLGNVQLSWYKAPAGQEPPPDAKTSAVANGTAEDEDQAETSTPRKSDMYDMNEDQDLDHF